MNTSKLGDESVLEELKMRLEAYLQQFIQEEPIITEDAAVQANQGTVIEREYTPENITSLLRS